MLKDEAYVLNALYIGYIEHNTFICCAAIRRGHMLAIALATIIERER